MYPKYKNVFRIETGNTQGWQVRIERRKRSNSKLFSDRVYGGTDAALKAALKWRDAMLEVLPPSPSGAAHLRTPRNKRRAAQALNRTGVIGIGFSMHTQRSGRKTPYVGCYWKNPVTGKREASSFSVNKHGLRKALRLACRRLREGRGETPTDAQIEYMVGKALPRIRELYEEAVTPGA